MFSGCLLAAAVGATFQLSDRSEVRLRDPGDFTSGASTDVETAPRAELGLASRRARLDVSYVPRLTLWNATVDPSATLLQSGTARFTFRQRRVEWTVDETASYGGVNLASSALPASTPGAPPKVDVVPVSRVLRYASSTSSVSFGLTRRRWKFGWSLGYRVSGGADADARTSIPWAHGPLAEGTAEDSLTRRLALLTVFDASATTFSSGSNALVVEATEGIRHRASRSATLLARTGFAEVRTRPSLASATVSAEDPVAEVAWEQGFPVAPDHLSSGLVLRVAPILNPIAATVDERAQASLQTTWARRRLEVALSVTAGQTVNPADPNAVSVLGGEMRASFAQSSSLTFDAGARGFAQRLNVPLAPGASDYTHASFVQGIAFVGVSVRAKALRF